MEDFENQLALERWWIEDARSRDRQNSLKLKDAGRAANDKGLRGLIQSLADDMALVIERRAEGDLCPGEVGGKSRATLQMILRTGIEPYELAYLILSKTCNKTLSAHSGRTGLASLAGQLAEALNSELEYRAMELLDPELDKIVRKVVAKHGASTGLHKRRVFTNLFRKRLLAGIPTAFKGTAAWPEIGRTLLELITSTHQGATIGEIYKNWDKEKKEWQWMIKPTQVVLDIFYRNMDDSALGRRLSPLGLMLNKPASRAEGRREMLLTRDSEPIHLNHLGGKDEATLEWLRKGDFGWSTLLDVMSYYESIPFRVNKPMLDWVKENSQWLKDNGYLPGKPREIPDSPFKDKDYKPVNEVEQARLRVYKKQAAKEHDRAAQERHSLVKTTQTLALATKMSGYSKFYFRWFADFRGRLYTLNQGLSFQGMPLSKSLLEFAEPVSIHVGNPQDLAWREFVECGLRLTDYYAKQPFEEFEPRYGNLGFWKTLLSVETHAVSKKNYLPFIAWKIELSRLVAQWGTITTTHAAIRKDATCSSMQHMAGLSGDQRILELTNCAPNAERPLEFYTNVVPHYKELNLERSDIKAFIMTFAYNATDRTQRKTLSKSFEDKYGVEMKYESACSTNDALKKAALEGLGRVSKLQELLMQVYRIICVVADRCALHRTPMGFIVDSTRYNYPIKRFRVKTLDAIIKIRSKDTSQLVEVNYPKTRNAWVANIIHSMDACLFWILADVVRINHPRLQFSSIHDCAVARPGEMGKIVQALGYAFKSMYGREPGSGMSRALTTMLNFWDTETEAPELYEEFRTTFQTNAKLDDMLYFFL